MVHNEIIPKFLKFSKGIFLIYLILEVHGIKEIFLPIQKMILAKSLSLILFLLKIKFNL